MKRKFINNTKKIVVIGGGTGTSVVLSGLKNYDLDLTAIVAMADNGGSTGRLRDEFGFQPVGDLRQSLAALAREDSQEWVRKLLLYRFSHGKGLAGHNLGNLILTALQDMAGSTPKALEIIQSILHLKGRVLPSTIDIVDLVVEYENGIKVVGQNKTNAEGIGGEKIKKVLLYPKAKIYPKTKNAIQSADIIIISPGDLYGSIIPNLIVDGMSSALKSSKAKFIYILNLMTRYTQTHNFRASDHLIEIKKYCGKIPDYVVINNEKIPENIIKKYQKEHEHPVENDLTSKDFKLIIKPLIKIFDVQEKADSIKRSLLRHDSQKLAQELMKIITSI